MMVLLLLFSILCVRVHAKFEVVIRAAKHVRIPFLVGMRHTIRHWRVSQVFFSLSLLTSTDLFCYLSKAMERLQEAQQQRPGVSFMHS